MAPNNHSDDIAELSRAVAQLGRLLVIKGLPFAHRDDSAAAAGMSAVQAADFAAGLSQLPPRQGLTYLNSILDRRRIADANFATTMRQPHGGSDYMKGAPEATLEAVTASRDQLAKDYPAWAIPLPDNAEHLGDDKPGRLVWRATHPDSHPVAAGTAWELRYKVRDVEYRWAKIRGEVS